MGAARLVASVLAVLTALAACTAHRGGGAPASSTGAAPQAVVVTSFNFGESELLAEIYAQALEDVGVPVRREFDLGPRELVQPALEQGRADLVPEYLGSALIAAAPDTRVDLTDPAAVLTALREVLSTWQLTALRPSRAVDANGFAVTKQTAARLKLRTLSDLAAVRPLLVLGGPTECPSRPYCLAGLRRVYGLQVARFVPYDDEAQRAAALTEGAVDVAVTFTTDGRLAEGDLVLLADDRVLQPADEVVPVVSQRALARYGATLRDRLDAVSAALDTGSLRFLNWRTGIDGKDVRTEARGWLERHGLVAGH